MRISFITVSLLFLMTLTACQTGEALNITKIKNPTASTIQKAPTAIQISQIPKTVVANFPTDTSLYAQRDTQDAQRDTQGTYGTDIATKDQVFSQSAGTIIVDSTIELAQPRTQKTYLINGLMSAIPFIGFGFRNLHKKMPEAQIYSYLSPIESAGIIMPKVMKDIEAAYAKDPNVKINLIGISLGADFVSIVAEKLHRKNIPVNYLGIVDGTSLRPVQSNVKKVDNLTCTYLDCVRGRVRLAKGNTTTILIKKKFKSSHIPLGNNEELHTRVIAQSRS